MTTEVNQHERAYRVWNALITCASQKQSISYKQLAQRLELHHRVFSYPLGLIQEYCEREHLPPLTVLVYNSDTGMPGAGFTASSDIGAATNAVSDFRWAEIDNPFGYASDGKSDKDIVQKILKDPTSASEVYSLVKSRGEKQRFFRLALLDAYRGRCAFSGSTIPETLDAAHIVPWSEATPEERFDVRNGLLLNTLCHRLFDKGYLVLKADYRIAAGPKLDMSRLAEYDKKAIEPLLGQPLRKPRHKTFLPSEEYIARRVNDSGEF